MDTNFSSLTNRLFPFSYRLREKEIPLFQHPEPIGQLKSLLSTTPSTIPHRQLPDKNVDNQNIFFCRYVYDNRAKRILKNPCLNNPTIPSTLPLSTSATSATTAATTTENPPITTTTTTTILSVSTAAQA